MDRIWIDYVTGRQRGASTGAGRRGTSRRWAGALTCVWLLGACGATDNSGKKDGSVVRDSGRDGTTIDSGGTCTLGTPDHCGNCATKCAGTDDAQTMRTCSGTTATATCGLLCKGEFYDVDGNAADGCELEDRPIQDSATTAVTVALPDVNNGGTGGMRCDGSTNPCTVSGQIYGDARTHEAPTPSRPMGREDWYKVTAVGTGTPNKVGTCLGISNFPADNQFEVCVGNDGDTNPATCMTATGGGASACVHPPTATDSGVFYVKVRKTAGTTNSPNKYALYLEH